MNLTLHTLFAALVAVLALVSAAACVAVVFAFSLAQRGLMRTAGPIAPGTTAR